MNKIKAFIYLDNYKMYSISSQIFKGLTEYVISSSGKNYVKSTEQKSSELLSGRVLGDIIEQSKNETEKKFLNDYAFSLFEEELRKEERVLDIDFDNINESITHIDNYSFVAVKGRLIFNDSRSIVNTSNKFNELGYNIGMMTGYSSIKEELDKLDQKVNKLKDRNQRVKNEELVKNKFEISKLLKLEGLQLNPHFLNAVSYLISYGYEDQFEIQMPFLFDENNYLFSGILNRDMFKENESTLVKKYSRESEKEFVLFGIPTQTKKLSEKIKTYANSLQEADDITLKEALARLLSQLGALERTFTGKLDYEYMIDPIAIYREI